MDQVIARSEDVENLGDAVSFQVQKNGRLWPAFVIRYENRALCYLNACAHVGLRLNGDKNEVFGRDKNTLVCRAHGAIYEVASGLCTDGPCTGYSLIALEIEERDGDIIYLDTDYTLVSPGP